MQMALPFIRFIYIVDYRNLHYCRDFIVQNYRSLDYVILRLYQHTNRYKIASDLNLECRRYRVKFLIADDPTLAISINADGIHIREKNIHTHKAWAHKQPNWHITASVHRITTLTKVQTFAHAALCGTVFPTTTHPNYNTLGDIKFRNIISILPNLRIYAIGGIDPSTARILVKQNRYMAGISYQK